MAQCAAKSKRTGERCRRPAIPGKRVCYHHGGKSRGASKGNKHTLKHGIYSDALNETDKRLWQEIDVQTIADEIRIAKLQLARALREQRRIDEAPKTDSDRTGFEFAEIEDKTGRNSFGPVDEHKIVKKRPDYRAVIDRLLGRIGKLVAIQTDIENARHRDDDGNLDAMLSRLDESRRRHGVG